MEDTLETKLKEAKDVLNEFYDIHKNMNGKPYEMAMEYLDWIAKKTHIIKNEKKFTIPDEIQIGCFCPSPRKGLFQNN